MTLVHPQRKGIQPAMRAGTAALICVSLIHSPMQAAPPSVAAPATQPATAPAPSRALPDLKPIEKQVGEIRSLKFITEVPAQEQSLEDFGKFVSKGIDEQFPADRREHMMAALVRLGLLTRPIDLEKEIKNALLSQAGAYYD